MLKCLKPSLLIILGSILLWLCAPGELPAFPLRIGNDCFYGEGESTGDGISTWMGYAVEFEPSYTPYTVDGVSIYISQMAIARDAGTEPRLKISVLDEAGILRQSGDFDWDSLEDHQGWVLIDLAGREYDGPFTVIIHSGIGLSPPVRTQVDAAFRLGVDTSEPDSHSLIYFSDSPPPSPPFMHGGMTDRQREAANEEMRKQAEATRANLVQVRNVIGSFPTEGNWMIRAHAPGLQTESTRVVITMADIERLHDPTYVASPDFELPDIEGFGPRGTVHCPTSLAGVTLYYYEEDRDDKFRTPHNNPWAHPELIRAVGAMCRDMSAEGIVGIEHIGIYNDRNIHGTNTRSSHAYGLGIDITGIKYSNGSVYLIEDHDDPEVRAILEHIRDDFLEKYFPTVMDWTYQRHENHFHVNLPYPQ